MDLTEQIKNFIENQPEGRTSFSYKKDVIILHEMTYIGPLAAVLRQNFRRFG
ncbi:hypothetical protein J8J42_11485 [Chryseobacterium sp. cx-311]|uniref:hypothetical protein n=1 Tax=Marnyiella aurantia TaxID=2758037 RepID=UPI001AE26B73|nr:hypothetical protein [Marnyiella aurantia]MBP0613660.1 hypothetical protein [Marnyiella aurantia]